MQITIRCDDDIARLSFSVSEDECQTNGEARCLLTVNEVSIEDGVRQAQVEVSIDEGECENLINDLCGWLAKTNAARKLMRERGGKKRA